MIDLLRKTKSVTVVLFLAGLAGLVAGCYYAGSALMHQQQSFAPAGPQENDRSGGPYSISITDHSWDPPSWFAPPQSATFTGKVRIETKHGFLYIVRGELRVTDSSGQTVRSWLIVKKSWCNRHKKDSDKLSPHSTDVVFQYVWDAKDAFGNVVPDAAYRYTFTAKFRGKSASVEGTQAVDTVGPTVSITAPQGQISSATVPVEVLWNDEASGVNPSSGVVLLDGTQVSGLSIDASGARGTIDAAVGEHTLSASVADLAGNEATATSNFDVLEEEQPGLQKTSVLGIVRDSNGQAIAGVDVTSVGAGRPATTAGDGSFLLELSGGGTHWVTCALQGYLPVQRPAVVPEGQHYNMGAIEMLAADPQLTTIAAEGGTAENSAGDVQLVVPAGALSAPVDIRLTRIPSSKVLPGPLNASDQVVHPISYTYCVAIEPRGTTFSSPATLRSPNTWGFDPGTRIPTAFWDVDTNRWIPDGEYMTVAGDGAWIEKQLGALDLPGAGSPARHRARTSAAQTSGLERSQVMWIDGNVSDGGGSGTGGQNPECTGSTCNTGCFRGHSSLSVPGGVYTKSVSLPSVSSLGSNAALAFSYRSDTASPSSFIDVIHSFRGTPSGITDWRYELEVNGQRKDASFVPEGGESRLLYFWDAKNGLADLSPTGLYTYTAASTARAPGYYALTDTWGGMPTELTSVPSAEMDEKRRVINGDLPLVNGVASPFGAGWHLSGLRRLWPQPGGKVMMVEGGDPWMVYDPRLNFARVTEGASVLSVVYPGHSGETRNMLGSHGTGAVGTGQITIIDYQDGFRFASTPGDERDPNWEGWDWVTIDLGQERQVDTLGFSFAEVDTAKALTTKPYIQIYTSLDNSAWALWSGVYEESVQNMTGVKVGSPYLASRGTPEAVRYVKYQIRSPKWLGVADLNTIYRLFAFGPSDRYGSGPEGQDEEYPRLAKIDTGWQQTEQNGTALVYDTNGFLQSVTDVHGNRTSYTWQDGLLAEIADTAGARTTLSYSGGKLAEVLDAAGRTITLTVDANGDLASVRMPDGSSTSFSYDARHLITSQTDPRGKIVSYEWDSTYPRLARTVGTDGSEISYHMGYYDHLLNAVDGPEGSPASPPPMSLENTLTDELGRVARQTWEFSSGSPNYYPDYRVVATDPLGRVTERNLHPRMDGIEVLRIEPDGSQMRFTYDSTDGRKVTKVEDMTEWKDGYGTDYRTKAAYTYEPTFGRIATSVDSGGHTTTYAYNDKGDLTSTTDALGNATTMTYDAQGQLVSVTDAEGAVTRYEYDSRGNRTKTTDPLGRQTTMVYDATGSMTSLTDPAGKITRWEHDVVARVTKVTDAAGGETRYVFEPGPCGGGCGGGSSNLLTSITDPAGRTTSFEYNDAGRMTAVVNPLGIRKEYTYDLGGRLTRFKNGRAQEITYEYDTANRLLRKTLPDEGAVEYAYSTNNQVTQVTDADSILRYEYATATGCSGDCVLKGAKKMEYIGSKGDPRYDKQASGSIKYTYVGDQFHLELLGGIQMQTDLTLTQGQSQITTQSFQYDAGHRLRQITPWNTTFGYDRVGRRTSMAVDSYYGRLGNTSTYQFDAAGQLLSLTGKFANGTTVTQFGYSYDQAGNRTAMTDLSGSHAFSYDDRYQLTGATHPTQAAENFGYDSVGNRTTSHISASYTYNAANQLLEDAEFTYAFDADGNCTGKVSKVDGTRHEYIFNSENRMTGYRKYDISSTLLTTADYFYDALGRRIAKRVNGATTRYMYHEEDIWLVITPTGIAVHYQHGPGVDEPLVAWASYEGSYWEPLYYFADALGTIRAVKGQDWAGRDMSATHEFDSFGQLMSSSSTLKAEWPLFTYTAREADPETGQLFLRARQYDPHTGRFAQEDALGPRKARGILRHLYTYAVSSPVLKTDPYGLDASTDLLNAGASCCALCIVQENTTNPTSGGENAAWLSCNGGCLRLPPGAFDESGRTVATLSPPPNLCAFMHTHKSNPSLSDADCDLAELLGVPVIAFHVPSRTARGCFSKRAEDQFEVDPDWQKGCCRDNPCSGVGSQSQPK